MDQISPTQFEVKKTATFTEVFVIVIEVFLGLVLIFFVFAFLNYVSILNLSKSFPFLSFLPVRHATLTQSDKLFLSQKAMNFAEQTILPSYLPNFQLLKNMPLDSLAFSGSVSAIPTNLTISYLATTKAITAINLLLFPDTISASVSASNATTRIYLKKYFAPEISTLSFTCTIVSKFLITCENFSNYSTEKRGYGMLIKQAPKNISPTLQLFACSITKDNPIFSKVSSCLNQ